MEKTLRLRIEGRVQGVGFRDWTAREARRRGLSGWVRNRRDGAVEAVIHGEAGAVDAMVEACRSGPAVARVDQLVATPESAAPESGFRQRPTQ
jgi:acylphosphatase